MLVSRLVLLVFTVTTEVILVLGSPLGNSELSYHEESGRKLSAADLATVNDNSNGAVVTAVQRRFEPSDAGEAQLAALPPTTSPTAVSDISISEQRLYGSIDGDAFLKPFGSIEPQKEVVIHEPLKVLPPTEETRIAPEEEKAYRFPDQNKRNVIKLNKIINTYTVQRHRVNVKKLVTHRHLKVVNVNTDYIINMQRVNHPHKIVEEIKTLQTRHVPIVIVKHTRRTQVREQQPVKVLPTEEVEHRVTELPPVVEKPIVERIGYDNKIIS